MPFIGNTPDVNFTSFAKQDLTGVTGSPAKRGYTLSHAVANANEIEVFVNNVRQEPTESYTVNGTGLTMTGDVETSDDFYIIYLGKAIQTTVPPDGSVSTAKIASSAVDLTSKVTGVLPVANGGSGMSEFVADQWRKTTDTSGALEPITDLERVDTTGQGTIGTAMSVSSGIFTFPATGIYLVRATFAHANNSTSSRFVAGKIQLTTDNSSYSPVAETYNQLSYVSSTTYSQSSTESLVNVTDTSNVKVKFHVNPVASNTVTRGLSTANYTHFTFIRLGA